MRLYFDKTGKFKLPVTLTSIGVDLIQKYWKSHDVETQALDPFIANLAPKEQHAIKAALARRMLGQQNAGGNTEPTKLDDGTVKTLLDTKRQQSVSIQPVALTS